jgi:hypothetical protein
MLRSPTLALLLPFLVLACTDAPVPVSEVASSLPAGHSADDGHDHSEHDGHGHPPAGAGAATARPEPGSQSPALSKTPLVFTIQEGWVEELPTNNVRKAQYSLPAVEGDPEDGLLVVYFFANGGGGVEANFARWASQFLQPDSSPSIDALLRSERTVNGMAVHEGQLSGTFVAETVPGSGERVNQENWRLVAAIVESGVGPYYFKLTGPEKTVRHWEASFRNFISELR